MMVGGVEKKHPQSGLIEDHFKTKCSEFRAKEDARNRNRGFSEFNFVFVPVFVSSLFIVMFALGIAVPAKRQRVSREPNVDEVDLTELMDKFLNVDEEKAVLSERTFF